MRLGKGCGAPTAGGWGGYFRLPERGVVAREGGEASDVVAQVALRSRDHSLRRARVARVHVCLSAVAILWSGGQAKPRNFPTCP
jgi:hypothetical protein